MLMTSDEGFVENIIFEQVTRMLTGGLNVVGIFVIAAADLVKAAQAQLRQVKIIHNSQCINRFII